jgi:hypothetical protein
MLAGAKELFDAVSVNCPFLLVSDGKLAGRWAGSSTLAPTDLVRWRRPM